MNPEKVKQVADLAKGDTACVVGYGTANLAHRHVTVVSVTKLYINVTYTVKYATGKSQMKARYRRDNGCSTPREDGYGGTTIHTTCQRPKKDRADVDGEWGRG